MSAKWRNGSGFSGDAQETVDCLEAIREENEGQLETEEIVKAARPKKSGIHQHFEWDDAIAAEEYRKKTARDLVRSIIVTVGQGKTEKDMPFYIHVSTGRREKGYYQSVEVATFDEFESALNGLRGKLAAITNSVGQLSVMAKGTKQKKVASRVRKATDQYAAEMGQML